MKTNNLQELKLRYNIVGRNEELDKALSTIVQVAATDLSVLIQGESGVGKEALPRILHDSSKRSRNKYIAINCGSIPEGTIDSELFGHVKGSFTGALDDREGYFGTANKGTLFLDEVGELPMSTQARLLRVLETGEYVRVGESEPRKTDVRIVAATNVNIPNAIREGRFREDLFYRLCTINVKLPPLRERGNDAVLLYKKFAMDTAEKYGIPTPLRLTPEAEETIRSYKWPGNIRQLKNVTEQMSILEENRIVTPESLRQYGVVAHEAETMEMATLASMSSHTTSQHDYSQEMMNLIKTVYELRKDVDELKSIIYAKRIPPTNMLPSHSIVPEMLPEPEEKNEKNPPTEEIQTAVEIVDDESLNIETMERINIAKALQRTHYNRKLAAHELGISERTLYRKIKDYGIEV